MKNILLLFTAIIFLFVIIGCGDDNTTQTDNTQKSNTNCGFMPSDANGDNKTLDSIRIIAVKPNTETEKGYIVIKNFGKSEQSLFNFYVNYNTQNKWSLPDNITLDECDSIKVSTPDEIILSSNGKLTFHDMFNKIFQNVEYTTSGNEFRVIK